MGVQRPTADLVELCRERGAPDNVTIAVARFLKAEPVAEPEPVGARRAARAATLDRASKKKRSTKRK